MIEPSVGRIVHYVPHPDDMLPVVRRGDPLAAIVAAVHDAHCVNLCVIDGNGEHHSKTSVRLVQPGEGAPPPPYCQFARC